MQGWSDLCDEPYTLITCKSPASFTLHACAYHETPRRRTGFEIFLISQPHVLTGYLRRRFQQDFLSCLTFQVLYSLPLSLIHVTVFQDTRFTLVCCLYSLWLCNYPSVKDRQIVIASTLLHTQFYHSVCYSWRRLLLNQLSHTRLRDCLDFVCEACKWVTHKCIDKDWWLLTRI